MALLPLPPARLKIPLRKMVVIFDDKRQALDGPLKAEAVSRSLTPLELLQRLYPRVRCPSVVMTATKRLTIPPPEIAIAGVSTP